MAGWGRLQKCFMRLRGDPTTRPNFFERGCNARPGAVALCEAANKDRRRRARHQWCLAAGDGCTSNNFTGLGPIRKRRVVSTLTILADTNHTNPFSDTPNGPQIPAIAGTESKLLRNGIQEQRIPSTPSCGSCEELGKSTPSCGSCEELGQRSAWRISWIRKSSSTC